MKDDSTLAGQESLTPVKPGNRLGSTILSFETVTSTNTVAKDLARAGAEEGTVVLADRQTQGKGRQARSWSSPPKRGLWFSYVLRPQFPVQWLGLIPLLTASSVASAIEDSTGLMPNLKWPNDVLVRGKKVCGILAESEFRAQTLSFLVVGVGLNVNQIAGDFPQELRQRATSLRIEAGSVTRREILLDSIMAQIDKDYRRFAASGIEETSANWTRRCPDIGKMCEILEDGKSTHGLFESLDKFGRLILRLADGTLKTIASADVNRVFPMGSPGNPTHGPDLPKESYPLQQFKTKTAS